MLYNKYLKSFAWIRKINILLRKFYGLKMKKVMNVSVSNAFFSRELLVIIFNLFVNY